MRSSLLPHLEPAFELAFFIVGERSAALDALVESLDKLELAARSQKKRRYYRPAGRASRGRTKVEMSRVQLLQRLIYIETEPHELAREAADSPSEEDLVVRFVKHLVRMTIKRNSFHVALGMARLMHDYPTKAAMDLFGLVVGDPDRIPDEDYFRARKRCLLGELEARFADRLVLEKGMRGEIRFVSRPATGWTGLVDRCLCLFTPWETPCPLPPALDPLRDVLPRLAFPGGDPDAEHPFEVRRMHALIHPPCFSILTTSLGLGKATDRLSVPRFRGLGSGDSSDRRPRSALTASEVATLERELASRQRRRRRVGAVLRVLVDGVERGRLGLPSSALELDLAEGVERVEVVGRDDEGDLVMAVFLPALLAPGESKVMRSPAGLEIVFHRQDEGRLTVASRELGLAALRRWWRDRASPPRFGLAWASAAAAVVMSLSMIGIWSVRQDRVELRHGVAPPVSIGDSAPAVPDLRSAVAPEERPLGEVRRVYLPPEVGGERRGELISALEGIAGLKVEDAPQIADAALKPWRPGSAELAMVDPAGRVLWRAPPGLGSEALARSLARAIDAARQAQRHSPSSTKPAQK